MFHIGRRRQPVIPFSIVMAACRAALDIRFPGREKNWGTAEQIDGGARHPPRSAQYRDTAAETRPSSVGRSLLRTSPFLVLLAIAAADAFNYANGDMWLHILIGRIILTTHRVPVLDSFSYTIAGHHVSDHEWLTELALVLVWRGLGSLGLRLFKLSC